MNRLAQQTSPYLRQHAANPVDWWPWCAAALEQARIENQPILLSIGYSACHWCHVMAHESFEDTETAAQMNRLFINIKVDREERPDLDQIYQAAHQMLAERGGGWPLTVFLTPDGMPFFSGTYFPPQARHGLPAFRDVLDWAADTYTNQRAAIDVQNRSLLNALQSTIPMRTTDADLDLSLPHKAGQALLAQFDTRYGGFGSSSQGPKFPRCPDLALLFRNAILDHDEAGQHAWLHTLRRMAEGGIFDHLGGGFSRYSVDARWDIPHFEKMLYDNGLLLAHYAEAFALTGDPLFARTARATANWAIREMQSEKGGGGFYAALDADSEGEEGKYYVWDRQEIARLLSPAQYAVFAAHYGLNRSANFEGRHWHLRIAETLDTVAEKCGISLTDAQLLLEESRACLLVERQKRIPPGCDDKILTGWNALMIAGLARAACVFDEPAWLASAQRAMDFVRERLWHGGRLRATCQAGQTARSPQSDPLNQPGQSGQPESAQLDAYLDDHACLLNAALALMQAEFRREDLDFACTLAGALLDHFEDRAAGGFFFTRDDHETLVLRPKPGHDNATPSGNGMAAQALQRLGHLLGETRYLTAAERTLRVFHDEIRRSENQGYWGSASLLLALAEYGTPPDIVILRGPAKETKEWQRQLQARCAPATLIFYLPNELKELPAAMDKPVSASPTAWICRGTECLPPIDHLQKIVEMLAENNSLNAT